MGDWQLLCNTVDGTVLSVEQEATGSKGLLSLVEGGEQRTGIYVNTKKSLANSWNEADGTAPHALRRILPNYVFDFE